MKQFKVAFQDPDTGLFEINSTEVGKPSKVLTEEEFKTLQSIMTDVNWITILWMEPSNNLNTK